MLSQSLNETVAAFIWHQDENKDGRIDKEEFRQYEEQLYGLVFEDLLTYKDPRKEL
jgi:hypothetical protein